MSEGIERSVEAIADILISECRKSQADQSEFEILVGRFRRMVHAATCAARVRYWHELNAKEGSGK